MSNPWRLRLLIVALVVAAAVGSMSTADGSGLASVRSSRATVHLLVDRPPGNSPTRVTPASSAGIDLTTFLGPVARPLPLPVGTTLTVVMAAPLKVSEFASFGGSTWLSRNLRTWRWTATSKKDAAIQTVNLLIGTTRRLARPAPRCLTATTKVPGYPRATRQLCLPVG
jgi:hypothetical protein